MVSFSIPVSSFPVVPVIFPRFFLFSVDCFLFSTSLIPCVISTSKTLFLSYICCFSAYIRILSSSRDVITPHVSFSVYWWQVVYCSFRLVLIVCIAFCHVFIRDIGLDICSLLSLYLLFGVVLYGVLDCCLVHHSASLCIVLIIYINADICIQPHYCIMNTSVLIALC